MSSSDSLDRPRAIDDQPAGEDSRAAQARVPDFFVIGHEKCGTTALYRILKSHPQIFLPEFKEPRFFSNDQGPFGKADGPVSPTKTLEGYLGLFEPARADQLAGDASPQYIRSPTAAQDIAAMQPDARIIAILREPVSFIRSYHLQCVRSNIETQRDLKKAIALEGARRQGRKIPRDCAAPLRLLYCDHVRYLEQLQRFRDVFAAEQMLVLIYDDLRRDNEATARSVLRFLGVDASAPLEISSKQPQVRKAVRSTGMNNFTRAITRARRRPDSSNAFMRTVNSLLPRSLDPLWRRLIYAAPAALDERFADELRRRFKHEVVGLSEYMGRDLVTLWGFDHIS
jgi:Sulfotransferase domain